MAPPGTGHRPAAASGGGGEPAPIPPLRRPASCAELFWVFNRLSLQGFGGVLAVAQRELVERERWVGVDDFVESLSLAQVLPGPNIINLSLMLGDRFLGWRGALAALAGMLAIPLAVVLALASLYNQGSHWPAVNGALRGMGMVAAGLIAATAVKLLPSLRHNRLGRPACAALLAATVLSMTLWRLPLWMLVLGLGGASVAWAWVRLGPVQDA